LLKRDQKNAVNDTLLLCTHISEKTAVYMLMVVHSDQHSEYQKSWRMLLPTITSTKCQCAAV